MGFLYDVVPITLRNEQRPSFLRVNLKTDCVLTEGATPVWNTLVACRSEFITAEAAGGVGVFPLDRPSVGGVGVDVATEFAS
jgi:hypothetical protein